MIILINVWFLRSPGVSLFVYRITPYIFPYTYYPLSLLLRMLDVKFTGLYFILGILIAGGVTNGDTRLKSAELFNPNSGVICPVADLPEITYSFTSCNGLQCGGWQSRYGLCKFCSPKKINPPFFLIKPFSFLVSAPAPALNRTEHFPQQMSPWYMIELPTFAGHSRQEKYCSWEVFFPKILPS